MYLKEIDLDLLWGKRYDLLISKDMVYDVDK